MIEVINVINQLSKKRPIFHSEADFQYSLAWIINEIYPSVEIRLEKRALLDNREVYFDILVSEKDRTAIIEVKYKTKDVRIKIGDEEFKLKNQGAQDQARYDFIKDILRLERALEVYPKSVGFAIFLTNDSSYWSTPKQDTDSIDKDFRIHNGRMLSGLLSWKEEASEGTRSKRDKSIRLRKSYRLGWRNYSNIENRNGRFRYLAVKVADE